MHLLFSSSSEMTSLSIPGSNCCLRFCLDPIPGGCNLEFALEIDPNIYVEYNLAETHIKFAPGNIGCPRYLQLALICKET